MYILIKLNVNKLSIQVHSDKTKYMYVLLRSLRKRTLDTTLRINNEPLLQTYSTKLLGVVSNQERT